MRNLKEAVNKAPYNPVAKILRAATHIALRGRFSEFEVANKELKILEKMIQKSPSEFP